MKNMQYPVQSEKFSDIVKPYECILMSSNGAFLKAQVLTSVTWSWAKVIIFYLFHKSLAMKPQEHKA